MKNLAINKIIVVPYTLICISIGSSIIEKSNININEMVSGFHISNVEVDKNKKLLLEKPKLKRVEKKFLIN